MGNIRTKDIKNGAASLYRSSPEKYGDFEKNKKAINEMRIIPNKRMRNKIAGYMVRVVKNKNRHKYEVSNA